ncbi:MAG: UDP-N-acetylmuramoyl-tripeptide--D-alanyl-D-alanine ligase [Candidatus Levyibacteriota bacterium]|nr:MAG: UDP-N-acetylmuramoyl-tripeptide--D-alanyl-D-alanine ligase [Candidatus Levybacteria bacterium]
MSILSFFTSLFFGIWITRNILFWISLWQTKEYRFDRMWAHIKDTEQGRGLFLSPLLLLKLLGIFAYGFVIYENSLLLSYQVLIGLLFLYQAKDVFLEVRSHTLKRPVFTPKAFVIFLLSIIVASVFFFLPFLEESLWFLILDRIVPIFVALFIFFFSFPTELYRDFQIGKAEEKIRRNKKLLTIGITGSYGKSSTKEYVAQILRKKFRVLKTKGTNNTAIGVANTILAGLQQATEIFVVEMGAYKRGEIAQICRIVHPKIGILTAVNKQHVSLFGSLENTIATKYELIDSLPNNGLAIFNGNNINTDNLYLKTDKRKVLYVCEKSVKNAQIVATNVQVKKTSVSFTIVYRKKKIRLQAPVIGSHTVENILPAIYLGLYLHMKDEEIRDAVSSFTPPQHTMTRHELGGVSLIDDTFNANPQSVLAALLYMSIYTEKKILVMQPMIELGKDAHLEHKRIGKAVADVCDYLLLTNNNYRKDILEGIKKGEKKCHVYIGSALEIIKFIESHTKKGDVVVFEGKEAGLPLEKIL